MLLQIMYTFTLDDKVFCHRSTGRTRNCTISSGIQASEVCSNSPRFSTQTRSTDGVLCSTAHAARAIAAPCLDIWVVSRFKC